MNNCKLEDKFQILQTLGKGAFSVVYKVKRFEDGHIYALKKVSLKNLKPKEIQNALNEIRILASIKHPNIVAYREAFIDRATSDLCIVMEFAGGGDLSGKIKECREKRIRFPENMVVKFFYQLASSLYELHMRNIIHRDLKTANIFLTFDLKSIKLGDMNVSKIVKNIFAYTQTGTPYYASPEVWRDEPYSIKTDVWSLGCVMYELCMLRPPFNATDMDGLFDKVQKCSFDPFDSFYSKGLRDAIMRLLTLDPHHRPNCEKILNFPIFNNLKVLLDDNSIGPGSNENLVFVNNELIETIKPGNDFFDLERKLPKPQYTNEGLDAYRPFPEMGLGKKSSKANPELAKKPGSISGMSMSESKMIGEGAKTKKGMERDRMPLDYKDQQNSQVITKSKRRSDSAHNPSAKEKNNNKIGTSINENRSKVIGDKSKHTYEEPQHSIKDRREKKSTRRSQEKPMMEVHKNVFQCETTPAFPKEKRSTNHKERKKSIDELQLKEEFIKSSPKVLMQKHAMYPSQIISVSQKNTANIPNFNLTSDAGSIDSRTKSVTDSQRQEMEVKNLQQRLRQALSRDNHNFQSPQDRVRLAYNPSSSPMDKHSFDIPKSNNQPSRQLLVNKKSVTTFQKTAPNDNTENHPSNSKQLPSANSHSKIAESNIEVRNSHLSVSKVMEERRRHQMNTTKSNNENLISVSKASDYSYNNHAGASLENVNRKLMNNIRIYGDINELPTSKLMPESLVLKKEPTQPQTSKTHQPSSKKSVEKIPRAPSKKSSVSRINKNPEIVDYLCKFRIKSSKETQKRLLDNNLQAKNLYKSNIILNKFNNLYSHGQNLPVDSNSIDASDRNIRSLITNFSIGAKKKSTFNKELGQFKGSLEEPSTRLMQKVNALYVVGANSMLSKSKKSIVNVPEMPPNSNSHLFKKQVKPMEVKDTIQNHTNFLPSLIAQRRSSKSIEPRNPSAKIESRQSNFGIAMNDLIVEGKLKGTTQKRALSAGIFKRPQGLLPNNRLLSSQNQLQSQVNGNKFVLRKKAKDISENPSAPLAPGSKGNHLNMGQFVKFIKHQYGKTPKDASEPVQPRFK